MVRGTKLVIACEQAPRNRREPARSAENWSLQACLCKSNVCGQILDAKR